MRRSDTAAATDPTYGTSVRTANVRPTLQVVTGLQGGCSRESVGGDGASDASSSAHAVAADRAFDRASVNPNNSPVEAASYRVSVTFTIAAAELEEFVSAHLCHPRSTDVRIVAVDSSR